MSETVGPPFTVQRYGSFGETITAENSWLRAEVERLHDDNVRLKKIAEEAIEAANAALALGKLSRALRVGMPEEGK